jgi:hypothetical protein
MIRVSEFATARPEMIAAVVSWNEMENVKPCHAVVRGELFLFGYIQR